MRTALLMLMLAPAAASAATIDQIVALSKAGVTESVIIALIDRDKSVFTIEADTLVALRQADVSDAVVLAMLRSGREPVPEEAAPLPLPEPLLIVVGHGPDRPNTARENPDATVFPSVALVPYAFFAAPPRGCTATLRSGPDPRTPTFGRFMSDPTARFMNNGWMPSGVAADTTVIDCPPAPSHRHYRSR